MIENYLKVGFRNITKNKIYSFINIAGLTIGFACCIIIASFIQLELSYDTFHKNANNIYRVNLFGKIGDNEFNVANSPAPLASALLQDYPEVENSVRIQRRQDTFIKKGTTVINEPNFFYADSTIFDVFTLNLIEGNSEIVLSEPNSILITPAMVKKYFNKINPVGKSIILDDDTEYLITGIVEEMPANSHFHFDFLASMQSIEVEFSPLWVSNNVYTYVVLNKKSSGEDLENKLPQMVETRVGPQIQAMMGMSYDDFNKSGNSIKFFVEPLKDIHLSSTTYANIEPGGDIDSVYIFTAIAIVILLLACINFVNLTTSRSSRRSNEVGIRKVLGSHRSSIIKQFLSESLLLTFISLLLSIGLIEAILPLFNSIIGKEIGINYFSNWEIIPVIIITAIIVGILAGSYPAFLLASFRPISVLKGKSTSGGQGERFRSVVVVFQFTITIILLSSTFIIYNQLEYVQNKKLGYNNEQVIILPTISELGNQKIAFKNSLLENSNILKASLSSSLPNRRISATIFRKHNAEENKNYAFVYNFVDYEFLDTYELELKEGRFFSKKFSTDTNTVLINETAVLELGLDKPIGKSLVIPDENEGEVNELKIIGIVKDFHFENLRKKIRPIVFALNEEKEARFLSLKISPQNISATINLLENKWEEFLPGKAFEYQFMDEDFNLYYQEEMRTGKLFSSFTFLAVFIACLGLLGLISFSVEQRTKEIGIRKVMGASITTILMLLSKDFVKWLIIANLLAIPVVYYSMNQWLQNFAYRDSIAPMVFVLAGLLSLIISFLTVSSHTIKAAMANPVDSLRNE